MDFPLTIHEPDVALTDVLLAIIAFALSIYLKRRAGWLPAIIFGAVGLASLLGALFHAFFSEKAETPFGFVLWMAVALAIGVGAAGVLIAGLRMIFTRLGRHQERLSVLVYLGSYLGTMIFVDYRYGTVVAFCVPAFLVLLIGATYRTWRDRSAGHGLLIAGILLSVVAAALQQAEFGLPQLSLSHNAVYHLVQAVGLFVLARGFVLARA